MDINLVVKHLANGSLSSDLCLICLMELEENKCDSIFTRICKVDKEFSIADVLETVCQIKLEQNENFNVCINCFNLASTAYKFYLTAKRSNEIINHYTNQLLTNIENIGIGEKTCEMLLFLPLPSYEPVTEVFDYNYDIEILNIKEETYLEETDNKKHWICENDDKKLLFEVYKDGIQEIISESTNQETALETENKVRKKRDPMVYMSCSRCPIKYRFVAKLKEHMKSTHGVDLYYCKICKLTTENKCEYDDHILTHKGEHQCTVCNLVYKKYETLAAHMKSHENSDIVQSENANICEVCGVILEDESSLLEHARKHVSKYTCYYCGKMYKGESSFEAHIKKHEDYDGKNTNKKSTSAKDTDQSKAATKRSKCNICDKTFVDERSLLWHQRLHNNDRPYACKWCERSFVSVNRRNQHAVCAHSPPARRCPLCPALFHLKSMVNTHLKKVHLKSHKRRVHRNNKYKNVYWRTETVPIQELSVSIQNDILELKNRQEEAKNHINVNPSTSMEESSFML